MKIVLRINACSCVVMFQASCFHDDVSLVVVQNLQSNMLKCKCLNIAAYLYTDLVKLDGKKMLRLCLSNDNTFHKSPAADIQKRCPRVDNQNNRSHDEIPSLFEEKNNNQQNVHPPQWSK